LNPDLNAPELAPSFQIGRNTTMDRDVFTDDKLKYTTEGCVKEQSELVYFTGIRKLRDCNELCTDKGGD